MAAGRGALSHLTSASLQGLVEGRNLPIQISTTQSSLKSPSEVVVVHRVNRLETRDLRWIDGMRVTNAVRTVLDLAGDLPPEAHDHVLDEARRRRLVAERPLREALERLGRRGRTGTARMRALLEMGELDLPVPGSKFERDLLHFIARRGFPEPARQVPIVDAGGDLIRRVDFAYPDLKLAIECDGKKHHFGVEDWEDDVAWRSRAAALGWRVLHISWDMLKRVPEELESLLRDALGVRGFL